MGPYEISKKIVDKEILDERILLDLSTGNYHSLNSTAAIIWSHLKSKSSKDIMIEALETEYSLDGAHPEDDIDQLILNFLELGFIK